MLTQKRAFAGEDVSDTLASVLRGEPDWSALPPETAHLTSVLQRCLEKDVKRRLRDIADVKLLLEAAPRRDVVTPMVRALSIRPLAVHSIWSFDSWINLVPNQSPELKAPETLFFARRSANRVRNSRGTQKSRGGNWTKCHGLPTRRFCLQRRDLGSA